MECSTGDTMTVKERENLMKKVKPLENKLSNNKKCPGKNNKKQKKCTKWIVERWTAAEDRARQPRRRAVRAVEEREVVREEEARECRRC